MGGIGMDPVALILAALAAGAGDTAAAPVKDAHAALMAQLRMRLADRADGEAALARYEESAPGWEAALGAELAAAGADTDEGLLAEAQAVMSVADAPGWRAGKYTAQTPGGQARPDG
jgi:hypothetical protein